jgi:hypothetical protein
LTDSNSRGAGVDDTNLMDHKIAHPILLGLPASCDQVTCGDSVQYAYMPEIGFRFSADTKQVHVPAAEQKIRVHHQLLVDNTCWMQIERLQWVAYGPSVVTFLATPPATTVRVGGRQGEQTCRCKALFRKFPGASYGIIRTVKRPHQPVGLAATAGHTGTGQKRKSYNHSSSPPTIAPPQINGHLISVVRGHCGLQNLS